MKTEKRYEIHTRVLHRIDTFLAALSPTVKKKIQILHQTTLARNRRRTADRYTEREERERERDERNCVVYAYVFTQTSTAAAARCRRDSAPET